MRINQHRGLRNPLKGIQKAIRAGVAAALTETADDLIAETKANLKAEHEGREGGTWTGILYNDIYHDDVQIQGNNISVRFYAGATNPYNGALYAQFLEQGTGDQGEGTGQKKWRYKDRKGEWHTTSGMKATPFLEPKDSNHQAIKALEERVHLHVQHSFALETTNWYKNMLEQQQKQLKDVAKVKTNVPPLTPAGGISTDR